MVTIDKYDRISERLLSLSTFSPSLQDTRAIHNSFSVGPAAIVQLQSRAEAVATAAITPRGHKAIPASFIQEYTDVFLGTLYAAIMDSSHVLGCGGSGVSQFIAQNIGARFRIGQSCTLAYLA